MAPVSGWDILGSKLTCCPQSWCVRSINMGNRKDLSKFNKGQIVMARRSEHLQNRSSWGVPQSCKSNPKDELLLLKLLKKLMLVLIERCQNTQCIACSCVWGCIAADRFGCPCRPLSKVSTTDTQSSELHHGTVEEGGQGWWIMFAFTSHGWPGAYFAFLGNTWHQDALQEEGKPAEAVWYFGQCSVW